MLLRKPCVAGRFYPADPAALGAELKGFLSHSEKSMARAVIAPHAGYMFSGAVAGSVYASVHVPDKVILLGPNHTGLGKKVSLMDEGVWDTPLGAIRIDQGLSGLVLDASSLFQRDTEAHRYEHSLEVQLPFIYSMNPNASIVPITVMRASIEECDEMGKAIAEAVRGSGGDVLIVVSSDMNHYESDAVTRKKDEAAIERVLALDAKGLLEVADEKDITMCGVIPAAIGISAAKYLGAMEGKLIKYATSGEVNGDLSQVVGYAGIVIR